jgi:hypothetical protein
MARSIVVAILLLVTGVTGQAQGQGQGRGRGPQPPPNVVGAWAGTWSSYNPAKATTPPQEQCAKLSANIVQKGEIYEAIFEGDCGRPYKYTITMEGRLVGGVVMFKGSVDLGQRDGGVYDWIGRAIDNEFVGFYTNAYYTGVFSLSRPK